MLAEIMVVLGAIGFYRGFRLTRKEKHQRCLANTERLEFENKCLDASNSQSQSPSPFSGVPTR